jgi:hypothetical protein
MIEVRPGKKIRELACVTLKVTVGFPQVVLEKLFRAGWR